MRTCHMTDDQIVDIFGLYEDHKARDVHNLADRLLEVQHLRHQALSFAEVTLLSLGCL